MTIALARPRNKSRPTPTRERCPTCGHVTRWRRTPTDIISEHIHGPTATALANKLVKHFGQWVPCERLINAAYGDRRDGGPDDALGMIRQSVVRIRRALAETELELDTGYRTTFSYRIRWRYSSTAEASS